MLLHIRGVYNESDRVRAPTSGRLEMIERALRSGNAFPTNHYFVTDSLWKAFQDATRQCKGGFCGDVEFIHPCMCRRAHHKLEVQVTRWRWHRYAEWRHTALRITDMYVTFMLLFVCYTAETQHLQVNKLKLLSMTYLMGERVNIAWRPGIQRSGNDTTKTAWKPWQGLADELQHCCQQ